MTDMPPARHGASTDGGAASGTPAGVPLDTCDREPIHIPSLIQPHGALVAVAPATGVILHASENLATFLPRATGWGAETTLAHLVGAEAAAEILTAAAPAVGESVRLGTLVLPAGAAAGDGGDLHVIYHRWRERIICEFTPLPPSGPSDWLERFTDTLDHCRSFADFADLVGRLAAAVRSLTGFDRVMVYRFEDDWSGCVIADDHAPHMESFLDLHYPAGDIPAQARRLYLRNRVRYVPDVGYEPVGVRAALAGADPLDMSHCVLRSVSPVHIQYLKNMGVRSTMSISLIVDGRLWGLVACHHESPMAMPMELQRLCQDLSVSVSSLVSSALALEHEDTMAALAHVRHGIVDVFAQPRWTVAEAVARCEARLLRLAGASAGVLWADGRAHPFGEWPEGTPTTALVDIARECLARRGGPLFCTEDLAASAPTGMRLPPPATGLAALSLGPDACVGVAWLRPEWRREVSWGGDPNQAQETVIDARGNRVLMPRASFARWSTEVGGSSRPWTDVDRAAIEGLVALRPILGAGDRMQTATGDREVVPGGSSAATEVYWQTGRDGVLAVLSGAFGSPPRRPIGSPLTEIFAGMTDAVGLARLERAIAAGRRFSNLRLTCVDPGDGEVSEFVIDGEPMRDSGGLVTGMHGSLGNRAGSLRDERSLRLAKEAAERASAAKSTFLATVSHEIRTPLNAVIGLASLVADEADEGERRRLAARLHVAGTAVLDLVSDVLELAKIESAEIHLDQSRFAVGDVLQQVHDLLSAQASEKRIELRIDAIGEGVPGAVLGDAKRLRQVLVNLVGNAIRCTREGFVRVSTETIPALSPGRVRLAFEVSDSGMGIALDEIPRLFTPFYQGDSGPDRRAGGAGLGLSIVRHLVTLMDGAVSVRSRPGAGATFRVEVELHPGDMPAPAGSAGHGGVGPRSPGAGRLAGMHVLLVDDDEPSLLVARRWLEKAGARVSSLSDGQGAIDWLAANGADVDVVLMDVQMPRMDGNQAVRILRGMAPFGALPILGLSAGALDSERREALRAGMSGYLTKPIDPNTMITNILAHVRHP